MSWLSDALKFEKSKIGDIWEGIKKDPKRLILGVDPLSTGAWNMVLGRDDQPIVGDFGGPTAQNYENAEAKGINTGSARTLNGIAQTVAALYGGQAVGGAFGGSPAGGAAGGGAAGGGSTGANIARYAGPMAKALGGQAPTPIASAGAPPTSMQSAARLPQNGVISEQGAMGNTGPQPVQKVGGKRKLDPRMVAAILQRGSGGL